ncbi:multicopper oxidase domain-containing protein [Dermatophilaceae bacterium Soc4.6]
MSMPDRTVVPTPLLRRIAAAGGATILATTFLQAGAASAIAPARSTVTAAAAVSSFAAATPSTAVGKLAPSGCAVTDTVVTCDLWASAGTQQVAGADVPIWGFGPDATTPSTPGPNLVVRQGDTVSITVHNTIDGQTVGLAIPGIAAGDFSSALHQDGAASGGMVTYTFTASRAGTYLYEAGHDPNGARQAAMGLVGALVVLAADHDTTTQFTDESVVVLSEIDPALAAHPTTYDLRSYHPRYRLLNGKSFPSTDSIATNPGNTVLLRYVNAGQKQHPMTVLGATQKTVSRDSHPLGFAEGSVTAVLEPGMTSDALVDVPSNGTSKFVLYESGAHLDAEQLAGVDSTETAFGGIMTYLDTLAAPASTDSAGPKTSAVSFSANPADGQSDISVTATISDATTGTATVAGAEYVIDDATGTGPGSGIVMTVPPGAGVTATATGTITPAQMASLSGKHTVYVRGQDVNGNWGAFVAATLNVQGYGALTRAAFLTPALTNATGTVTLHATGDDTAAGGTVTSAEYYFGNTAPDLTTSPPPTPAGTLGLNRTPFAVVAETATVDNAVVAALGDGKHSAWIRSKDSRDLWGPLIEVPFTVDLTAPSTLVASLEPSPTNGLVSAPGHPGYVVVSATIDDGSGGSTIADAEAFVNPTDINAVTNGSGLQLIPDDPSISATATSAGFYGLIPLSAIRNYTDGQFHLYVHGQDAAGNWGEFLTSSFQVDRTAPVLANATQGLVAPATTAGAAVITATVPFVDPNNPVSSTWQGGAEFWFGTTDPGVGKATRVTATLNAGILTLGNLPVTGTTPGSQRLNVRAVDLAGNWSNTASTTLTVNPVSLVTESFTGPLNGSWTTTGAGVSVQGGSLQVSSASASAYLKAPASAQRPVGATLPTATVTVDVDGTGVTRAGWTTVAAATGSSGQVFGLQLQKTATGQVQLRTVLTRVGLTPANGKVVVLPTGKATVSLGWRAGPKKGTSVTPQGQLTLSLDRGASVASTSTGNTTGLGVSGISLGVVGTPAAPGLRQTLRLDNLAVTP